MKKLLLILSIIIVPQLFFAQSLEDLLQEASSANPQLNALLLNYEAAQTKADQVSQLSQPTIGLGLPVQSVETRLGPQVLMVSASQLFPWFGTLNAKESVAISMSKVDYEKIAAIKLELFFKVKQAYYNLFLINEEQKIVRENIRLYEVIEQVALAKVESGKSTAADVLRVQIKIVELKSKIDLLQNSKTKHFAQINQICNRSISDAIIVSGDYNNVSVLDFDLQTIEEKLSNHHPFVEQLNAQIEASKHSQEVNKGLGAPSFSLGLDYGMVDKRTDANPELNGQDILIPKAMLTIPIFRKQFTSKNKEELLNQQVFALKQEDVVTKLLASLVNYKSMYDDALINMELAADQIQKTESANEILISEYSSTGTNFDEVIQLQNQLLQYKLNLIRAQNQTHISKANIERITDF